MLISKQYKIELAAHDDSRPILAHVNITSIKGQSVAVAADGWMLAVVPVQLEDEDVTGMVKASVFAAARKLASGQPYNSRIRLPTSRTVVLEDGSVMPRLGLSVQPESQWPAFMKIAETAFNSHTEAVKLGRAAPRFAFNPELVKKLSKVFKPDFFALHISASSNSPIIFTPEHYIGKELTPPFGIVMPGHLSD